MTAIAAIYDPTDRYGADTLVSRALAAQAMYGSARPRFVTQMQAALGWDIFGQAHAPAPLRLCDGRLTLVADIRLTNRSSLIGDLDIDQSRAVSDAQLLGHAIETWGTTASFDRLRGDFAIAVWDEDTRQFTLARDLTGNRPLHFHLSETLVAVASMPSGLNALPNVPGKPDIDALARAVAAYQFDGDATHWQDVQRVMPGHYVTLDGNRAIQTKYWRPRIHPVKLPSYAAYVEAMRDHVDRAVASCIGHAEHVATHLSAGLDSSAITARAAHLMQGRGRITAYTAAPREGYAVERRSKIIDEAPFAAETVAMHDNVDHIVWRPKPGWSRRELDRAFDFAQAPPINLCNLHWIHGIFDEMAASKETLLLTGAYGNLALSHDGTMQAVSALMHRDYRAYLREIWGVRKAGPKAMLRLGRSALSTHRSLSPKHNTSLTYSNPRRGDYEANRYDRALSDIFLMAASRVDVGLLAKSALAGWGIDMRDPTTDRDLVEFSLGLPSWALMQNGASRSVLRDMMQGKMSEGARVAPIRGLQAADWHEGASQNLDWLHEELEASSEFLPAHAVIDTDRLQSLLDDWPEDGWEDDEVYQSRRLGLLRGVSLGHFIRRAGGANR